MLIFRGGNQWIGQSTTTPVPADFTYIGAGYLPELPIALPFNVLTMLLGLVGAAWIVWHELRLRAQQKRTGSDMAPVWVSVVKVVVLAGAILWAAWLFATGRPGTSFPISGVILVVLVIIYSFVTNNTVFGRHIYAVGGNRLAASLSGVKDRRVDFFVMMNMSVLAALAGMIFVARSTASGPQDGNGWELDAIAAVFIGGAAVSGGIGTVIGSIIGGLVMAFLNNGLQLLASAPTSCRSSRASCSCSPSRSTSSAAVAAEHPFSASGRAAVRRVWKPPNLPPSRRRPGPTRRACRPTSCRSSTWPGHPDSSHPTKRRK